MNADEPALQPKSGTLRLAIRRFALIGGLGFLTEAVVLTTLIQLAGWTPWQARVPSFLIAVTLTWMLNRKHTFAGRGLEHRSLEAFAYIVIQACGAAVNFAIFGVCLSLYPRLARIPVIPLAVGAVGGFVFNFAVSNLVLYRRRLQTTGIN